MDELNIRGLSCASALEDIFNDILSFRVMSDITVTNDIKIDDESGDIINLNIIEIETEKEVEGMIKMFPEEKLETV